MNNFKNIDGVKCKVLSYSKDEDFEQYIVKVLALKKIENEKYSQLIFSVDPGARHLGLVIFLDDYYLNSHTIFEKDRFIEKIRTYINALQGSNTNPLKLVFKIGKGIMSVTLNLIDQLFKNLKKQEFRVLLIDESKSSKYKIRDENRKKIPKDEAAALIISLRDGFEITYENYKSILKQKRIFKKNSEEFYNKSTGCNNDIDLKLIKIVENLLKGGISLSKSMELLKSEKMNY
jgi:hypothetical protein